MGRLGHGLGIDQTLFKAEDPLAREMPDDEFDHAAARSAAQTLAIRRGASSGRARDQLEAIGKAERQHLRLDVVDLEDRRLRLRSRDEGAGLATALDQAGARELGQHVAHRHARTVVGLGQLVLGGDPRAGRQLARQDLALQVAEDLLVKRLGRIAHEACSTLWSACR
jgi:hypothetical protein